jgi:hypothetical protein
MKTPLLDRFSRLLSPSWFFAGVAIGMGLCIWSGKWASHRTLYSKRLRFYFKVAPTGTVYPTVDNLRHFVKGKAPREKTLVLVGGSSILLGAGQKDKVLWSKILQEKLGPDFAVVNISFRGCYFTSVGLPIAEILSKEYARWYYITDFSADWLPKWNLFPKGPYPYRYVLWQSWLSRQLLKNPGRDAELKGLILDEDEAVRRAAQEDALGAMFEIQFRASSLWNYIGDRYFFPAYCSILPLGVPFWIPRKEVEDDEFGDRDGDERFTEFFEANMRQLHLMVPGGGAIDESSRDRMMAEHEKNLDGLKNVVIDPTVRRRTLFVLASVAPYYLERLNPEERARYINGLVNDATALNEKGFNAMTMGLNYVSDDYVDFKHHSGSAAPKMAEDVAVKLRSMIQRDSAEASK